MSLYPGRGDPFDWTCADYARLLTEAGFVLRLLRGEPESSEERMEAEADKWERQLAEGKV